MRRKTTVASVVQRPEETVYWLREAEDTEPQYGVITRLPHNSTGQGIAESVCLAVNVLDVLKEMMEENP